MDIPALPPISPRRYLIALCLGCAVLPQMALAQDVTQQVPDVPVAPAQSDVQPATGDQIGFSAAVVEYDSNTEIVTAKGDVIVNRDGYTMRADNVIWNRTSGEVTANGSVRAVGPEGDVAYADTFVVTDSLKDGIVENLLVVLADESRLAAKRGTRKDGIYSLDYAAYTACKVENPNGCPKKPSWEVKAVKVVYDPATKRVKYQ
jgi:LPS-assembly protein